jgi:hypothetical protein
MEVIDANRSMEAKIENRLWERIEGTLKDLSAFG